MISNIVGKQYKGILKVWYDKTYSLTIEYIKNSEKKMSAKEYRKVAKQLDLLSLASLRSITNIDFEELEKQIRTSKI